MKYEQWNIIRLLWEATLDVLQVPSVRGLVSNYNSMVVSKSWHVPPGWNASLQQAPSELQ